MRNVFQLYTVPVGIKRVKDEWPKLKTLDARDGQSARVWANNVINCLRSSGSYTLFFAVITGRARLQAGYLDKDDKKGQPLSQAEFEFVNFVEWACGEAAAGRQLLQGAGPLSAEADAFERLAHEMQAEYLGDPGQCAEVDRQIYTALRASCSQDLRDGLVDTSGVQTGCGLLRWVAAAFYEGVTQADQLEFIETQLEQTKPREMKASEWHRLLRSRISDWEYVAQTSYRGGSTAILLRDLWRSWRGYDGIDTLRGQVEYMADKSGIPLTFDSAAEDIERWYSRRKPTPRTVCTVPAAQSSSTGGGGSQLHDMVTALKQVLVATMPTGSQLPGGRKTAKKESGDIQRCPPLERDAQGKCTKCKQKVNAERECACMWCPICRVWDHDKSKCSRPGGGREGKGPMPGEKLIELPTFYACPKCKVKPLPHQPWECEMGEVPAKRKHPKQRGNKKTKGDNESPEVRAAREKLMKVMANVSAGSQGAAPPTTTAPTQQTATVSIEQAMQMLASAGSGSSSVSMLLMEEAEELEHVITPGAFEDMIADQAHSPPRRTDGASGSLASVQLEIEQLPCGSVLSRLMQAAGSHSVRAGPPALALPRQHNPRVRRLFAEVVEHDDETAGTELALSDGSPIDSPDALAGPAEVRFAEQVWWSAEARLQRSGESSGLRMWVDSMSAGHRLCPQVLTRSQVPTELVDRGTDGLFERGHTTLPITTEQRVWQWLSEAATTGESQLDLLLAADWLRVPEATLRRYEFMALLEREVLPFVQPARLPPPVSAEGRWNADGRWVPTGAHRGQRTWQVLLSAADYSDESEVSDSTDGSTCDSWSTWSSGHDEDASVQHRPHKVRRTRSTSSDDLRMQTVGGGIPPELQTAAAATQWLHEQGLLPTPCIEVASSAQTAAQCVLLQDDDMEEEHTCQCGRCGAAHSRVECQNLCGGCHQVWPWHAPECSRRRALDGAEQSPESLPCCTSQVAIPHQLQPPRMVIVEPPTQASHAAMLARGSSDPWPTAGPGERWWLGGPAHLQGTVLGAVSDPVRDDQRRSNLAAEVRSRTGATLRTRPEGQLDMAQSDTASTHDSMPSLETDLDSEGTASTCETRWDSECADIAHNVPVWQPRLARVLWVPRTRLAPLELFDDNGAAAEQLAATDETIAQAIRTPARTPTMACPPVSRMVDTGQRMHSLSLAVQADGQFAGMSTATETPGGQTQSDGAQPHAQDDSESSEVEEHLIEHRVFEYAPPTESRAAGDVLSQEQLEEALLLNLEVARQQGSAAVWSSPTQEGSPMPGPFVSDSEREDSQSPPPRNIRQRRTEAAPGLRGGGASRRASENRGEDPVQTCSVAHWCHECRHHRPRHAPGCSQGGPTSEDDHTTSLGSVLGKRRDASPHSRMVLSMLRIQLDPSLRELLTAEQANTVLDEILRKNGWVFDTAAELSTNNDPLLYVSEVVADPSVVISFAEHETTAQQHRGHGKMRVDFPDRDGVPREVRLPKVYFTPKFRFKILSRADWHELGGSYIDSPHDTALVMKGSAVVIPANNPSLVTNEGHVIPLQQATLRNTRLQWAVMVVADEMQDLNFGVKEADPRVMPAHIGVTLGSDEVAGYTHPSDTSPHTPSSGAAAAGSDNSEAYSQASTRMGSIMGTPLTPMVLATPTRQDSQPSTRTPPTQEQAAVQAFQSLHRRLSPAKVCKRCGLFWTGCVQRGLCASPRGATPLQVDRDSMVLALSQQLDELSMATPAFGAVRQMLDTAAELERNRLEDHRMAVTPQECVQLALPLEQGCTRCGGPHRQSECVQPCGQCGHVWPGHTDRCEQQYDVSETRLMASSAATQPRTLTTDLEAGEEFPAAHHSIVAAAGTSADHLDNTPDAEIVSMYADTVLPKYLDLMPNHSGLPARQWVTLATESQAAQMCRAAVRVDDRLAAHSVESGGQTSVLWSPEAQADMARAVQALRRVVQLVLEDMAELLDNSGYGNA